MHQHEVLSAASGGADSGPCRRLYEAASAAGITQLPGMIEVSWMSSIASGTTAPALTLMPVVCICVGRGEDKRRKSWASESPQRTGGSEDLWRQQLKTEYAWAVIIWSRGGRTKLGDEADDGGLAGVCSFAEAAHLLRAESSSLEDLWLAQLLSHLLQRVVVDAPLQGVRHEEVLLDVRGVAYVLAEMRHLLRRRLCVADKR